MDGRKEDPKQNPREAEARPAISAVSNSIPEDPRVQFHLLSPGKKYLIPYANKP